MNAYLILIHYWTGANIENIMNGRCLQRHLSIFNYDITNQIFSFAGNSNRPIIIASDKIIRCSEVFYLRSNPEVLKYIGKEPCQSIEEATTFIGKVLTDLETGDGVAWVITLKDGPEIMIGHIGFWRMDKPAFRAEIGYLIHPQHWGKAS
jgi:ribosomal-protein-alanine N-acetyltransferase